MLKRYVVLMLLLIVAVVFMSNYDASQYQGSDPVEIASVSPIDSSTFEASTSIAGTNFWYLSDLRAQNSEVPSAVCESVCLSSSVINLDIESISNAQWDASAGVLVYMNMAEDPQLKSPTLRDAANSDTWELPRPEVRCLEFGAGCTCGGHGASASLRIDSGGAGT